MSIPAHIEHTFRALDRIERRESPALAATVDKSLSHDKNEAPTAGIGTADAGTPYKLTCRARYYDAASRILENELHLNTHDYCDELGNVIQEWVEKALDNWEPR